LERKTGAAYTASLQFLTLAGVACALGVCEGGGRRDKRRVEERGLRRRYERRRTGEVGVTELMWGWESQSAQKTRAA
jgi:hypothetical protein